MYGDRGFAVVQSWVGSITMLSGENCNSGWSTRIVGMEIHSRELQHMAPSYAILEG